MCWRNFPWSRCYSRPDWTLLKKRYYCFILKYVWTVDWVLCSLWSTAYQCFFRFRIHEGALFRQTNNTPRIALSAFSQGRNVLPFSVWFPVCDVLLWFPSFEPPVYSFRPYSWSPAAALILQQEIFFRRGAFFRSAPTKGLGALKHGLMVLYTYFREGKFFHLSSGNGLFSHLSYFVSFSLPCRIPSAHGTSFTRIPSTPICTHIRIFSSVV